MKMKKDRKMDKKEKGHTDVKQDKKLIKKMVKKSSMK